MAMTTRVMLIAAAGGMLGLMLAAAMPRWSNPEHAPPRGDSYAAPPPPADPDAPAYVDADPGYAPSPRVRDGDTYASGYPDRYDRWGEDPDAERYDDGQSYPDDLYAEDPPTAPDDAAAPIVDRADQAAASAARAARDVRSAEDALGKRE